MAKLKEEVFKLLPPTNFFSSRCIWPHFWAIQIILFVLIAMYCTMHELVRVIGKGKGAADILWADACA